jgi:RND family efflux transporter MFP subunit
MIPSRRAFALFTALALPALLITAADPVWVAGVTEPAKDITMAFPVVGIVASRPVAEGARIQRGAVVIELDKQLELLDVQRKKLAREFAAAELERLQTLAQRNAISVSREELDKKKAESELSRVDVELADAVLRRRQLIAPFEGEVAVFHKDVGEKCDEQQPVVRLVDTRRCILVVNLEPRLGAGFRVGQAVVVESESGTGTVRKDASVVYVSPVVDAASGLLRIKAEFDNTDGSVRPGVAGRIRLP